VYLENLEAKKEHRTPTQPALQQKGRGELHNTCVHAVYSSYATLNLMSASQDTTKCKNCPERFPKKNGKKFCSSKCKDEFWNAGATPTKALERRIFLLLKSDKVRAIIRQEVKSELASRAALESPRVEERTGAPVVRS
jgi:hypothetical protein